MTAVEYRLEQALDEGRVERGLILGDRTAGDGWEIVARRFEKDR